MDLAIVGAGGAALWGACWRPGILASSAEAEKVIAAIGWQPVMSLASSAAAGMGLAALTTPLTLVAAAMALGVLAASAALAARGSAALAARGSAACAAAAAVRAAHALALVGVMSLGSDGGCEESEKPSCAFQKLSGDRQHVDESSHHFVNEEGCRR